MFFCVLFVVCGLGGKGDSYGCTSYMYCVIHSTKSSIVYIYISVLLSPPQCVMIKETANDDVPLYAKIGCQHRDTYTSTKLQLIVYTDAQCSKGYGGEIKNDGYDLNGYWLSNKVKCLFLREICICFCILVPTWRLGGGAVGRFKMIHSHLTHFPPPLLPFNHNHLI